MAVRIIGGQNGAVLFCSTTEAAFGPVFEDVEQAEDFVGWLPVDARSLSDSDLRDSYNQWHDVSFDDDGAFDPDLRDREPTDDDVYNRVGVEGGIAYDTSADQPGSLGENDWRL